MNITDDKWSSRFLVKAKFWAELCSKDPSSKVGCLIVAHDGSELSSGYNGMPRGVNDSAVERMIRPEKYFWMQHAEENAIAQAARHGIKLEGAVAFVTHPPCSRCAGMMINAGIARVFVGGALHNMPAHETEVADLKFKEAGVVVTRDAGKLGKDVKCG